MRHFDVQLIGGIVLHQGKIAEMKTGEGKTLVATLPVYLNALTGKGVHVVTVNDYLARRDAEWMGKLYSFLGMTTGVNKADLEDEEQQEAYAADITYGTNNEFGFDYLRDNMKYDLTTCAARMNFAIVDEVDSILIDEARTPLIISGPLDDRSEFYNTIDKFIPDLGEGRLRSRREAAYRGAHRSRHGEARRASARRRPAQGRVALRHRERLGRASHQSGAARRHAVPAHKDYIVREGEVVIIDEFTGRMMQGRRYSEGLHQALEAKERQPIQPENQTLASITFQNYFRMYEKLAGMTGTASTEADEFFDIYKLEVLETPTNLVIGRLDEDDEVYRTAERNTAHHRRDRPRQ